MSSRVVASNPSDLRAAMVSQIQGIDALTALVPADNIVEYKEELNGDLLRTISDLRRPGLLVYIEGIAPTGSPALIRAGIGIAMRVADPFTVYTTLVNGVSTWSGSDGLPTMTSTILRPWSPMKLPTLQRRFILVDDKRVFDYWELIAGFTDRNS